MGRETSITVSNVCEIHTWQSSCCGNIFKLSLLSDPPLSWSFQQKKCSISIWALWLGCSDSFCTRALVMFSCHSNELLNACGLFVAPSKHLVSLHCWNYEAPLLGCHVKTIPLFWLFSVSTDRRAFKGWTGEQLSRLHQVEEIPGKRPRLVMDLVRCLVLHYLTPPAMSDEELLAILEKRDAKKAAAVLKPNMGQDSLLHIREYVLAIDCFAQALRDCWTLSVLVFGAWSEVQSGWWVHVA